MKYRTQTANVLNEADRFERILSWQLFCMEQEAMLYGYNPEVEWVPGDPLFVTPYNEWDDVEEDEYVVGNYVRPMIQIVGMANYLNNDGTPVFYDDDTMDSERPSRCQDCQVSWDHTEISCWMCGKEYPAKKSAMSHILDRHGIIAHHIPAFVPRPRAQVYFDFDIHVISTSFETFTEASERTASALRQMGQQLNAYAMADAALTLNEIYDRRRRDFTRAMLYRPRSQGYSFRRMIIDECISHEPTDTERVTVRVRRDEVESLPDLELFPTALNLDGDRRRDDNLDLITAISIPREIPKRSIPLPERESVGIFAPEDLLHRTYPTARVVTQERRSRQ